MQAIQTRYLSPTNTKGPRIKAWCQRGGLTLSCPCELDGEKLHQYAVDQLCAKFDADDLKKYGSTERHWSLPKAGGQLPNGDYVFVFLPHTKVANP